MELSSYKSNIFIEQRDKYTESIFNDTLKQLEYFNVLEFISKYAYSELGKNYVLSTLPIDDIDFLNEEHSLIDEMRNIFIRGENIPFDGLTDISHSLFKSNIENAVLNAIEILSILDTIRAFRLIKNFFIEREEVYPLLKELTSFLADNKILEKHINDAIDDSGEVRDNASRELQRIRSDIRYKSQKLRARLQKIVRKVVEQEIVREDFYTIREGRFVLPIKSENKRIIPGIIHGISQTGATVFLEPSEIIEINNELSLLANEELREIHRILSNLTNEIRTNFHSFQNSMEIIKRFDGIYAKAKYSVNYGGIKPKINNENYIYLKDIKHPILLHSGTNPKSVIPLSIEFNSKHRGHLISGPNAGGKTVALKSIGLNILMALSGIFPLGVCITNFRSVFASIGDHQSIEHNLSTFSSQMLQIKNIFDNCSNNSLILIDEICSGTDPQEGAAIACGILDSYINMNLFFIATTHQSSLKTYALNRPEIKNASLEFDSSKLKPTYKFLSGIPGNSYAFALSASIGISDLVLERAKSYLGDKQSELENSISILQQYKQEAEQLRNEAEEEKQKFKKLNDEYNKKNSEFKNKRKELLNEAKIEAQQIVSGANSLIESTIREIREEKKKIADIKQDFQQKKDKIIKEVEKINKKDEKIETEVFSTGDTVIMLENNSQGIIIEVDDEDKMALVEFGGFKFRLKLNQIKKTKAEKISKKDLSDYIKYDVKTRIDVRGMRADECIRVIDEFIQDALVNNVQMVTIVHGKGTGALKQAIHEFLKYRHSVKDFRLGELVEGGAGVTVVEV